MAQDSKIGWTEHTANPWWGCYEVHAGCDNCYARIWAKRMGFPEIWGQQGPRRAINGFFRDLDKYQRIAAKACRLDRVFVSSMGDIFEKSMPLVGNDHQPVLQEDGVTPLTTEALRQTFLCGIEANLWPNLVFLLLTKRPSNINRLIPIRWRLEGAPKNVWFGCSPVDQATADTLIPQLWTVNGNRFLSIEPMLGEIDLSAWLTPNWMHWVICGGESGHEARPLNPVWIRKLRSQCEAAGVPFFFKQWGEWLDTPAEEFPVRGSQQLCLDPAGKWLGAGGGGAGTLEEDWREKGGAMMCKVGTKAAGNLLDGVLYEQLPVFRAQ